METDDRDLVAEALPAYEILDELGRGAWGVVLAGRHRRLGRLVAVKQLPLAFDSDPGVRARFESEARLLALLDHPHIVPIYDFVEHESMLLLVMERLTGGTVFNRFRAGGFTFPSACATIVAACAGLHYAHERGLLHRDVKPENLMFSSDGVLKVTDFGIAKVLGGSTTARTISGEVLGTPRYISPEQAQGAELTRATDVYAAGMVLYELLAGRGPYPEVTDPILVMYQHVHEDPTPLLDVAPDVPQALAVAVTRALAREAASRFVTADEFGAAVASAAAGAWGPEWATASGVPLRQVGRLASDELAATVDARTADFGEAPTLLPAMTPTEVGAALEADRATVLPDGWVSPPARPPAVTPPSGNVRRRWPFLAAAGGVAATVAVVALLGHGGGPSKGPTRAESSATTAGNAAFPNQKERAVVAQLPTSLRASCTRGDPSSFGPGSEVTVTCSPAKLVSTVTYATFATAAALDEAYDRLRSASNVTRDTATDCLQTTDAERAYETTQGPAGRMLCYVSGDRSYLVWTVASQRILARAERGDKSNEKVLVWFESTVGQKFADFPNASEQALLLHVPPELRETCVRGVLEPNGLAALDCLPADVEAVFFNLMRDRRAAVSQYDSDRVQARLGRDAGAPGACPGEAPYTAKGGANGRLFCAFDPIGHAAYIQWTDEPLAIMTYASRNDGNASQLLGWWGGFGFA